MKELQIYTQGHPLLKNIPDTTDTMYYTEGFFHQLQPHLQHLVKSNLVISTSVDPSHIDLYAGDFYGYLRRYQKAVPYDLYWPTCRISGMNGPNDFDHRFGHIYLITDISVIAKIAITKKAVQKSAI